MNVRELKEFLDKQDDYLEIVVFKSGYVVHPCIQDVVLIEDEELYDQPIIEIGCGW